MLTATTSRPGSGYRPRTSAAGHHLPGRRPRDDLGRALLRPATTSRSTRRSRHARVRRWTASGAPPPCRAYEQVAKLRYVRRVLDESLRLWPTAPAFAREAVQDTVLGGRHPMRRQGVDAGADPDAAPRPRGVGRRRRASSTRTASTPKAVRARPPHAFKPFGTGARACIGRQFALHEATLVLGLLLRRYELIDHLHYQLRSRDPDRQAATISTFSSVRAKGCGSTGSRGGTGDRPAKERPAGDGRGRPEGRPARHPAGGAVRVQSRHGRVDRHPARPRGHRTRFRRHPRRARRHTSTTCRATAPPFSSAPPTTAPHRTTRARSAGGSGTRARPAPPTASRTPCSAAATREWAATYQAVPTATRRRSSPRTAGAASTPAARATPGDFDAAYRDWHSTLWADLAAALDLPGERRRGAPIGPRLSITLTNRQVTNPVIVSYRRQTGTGPRQPGADRAPGGQARPTLHPAHRDRPPVRRDVPRRRPPRACCPATASTSSAG